MEQAGGGSEASQDASEGRPARTAGLARPLRMLAGERPAALESLVGREAQVRVLTQVATPWGIAMLASGVVGIALMSPDTAGLHRAYALLLLAAVFPLAAIGLPFAKRPEHMYALAVPGMVAAPWCVALAGPLHQEVAVIVPAIAAATFVLATRRVAVVSMALVFVGYAAGVVVMPSRPDRLAAVLVPVAVSVITAVLVGWIVERAARLALAERAVSEERDALAVELDRSNRLLEARVASQVEEIGKLGQLQRFLSPEVARAVLSSGNESILEPHRREIAVLFCDLRAFTAFTAAAEPEDVVEVLGAYYAAAGAAVRAHGATMGRYIGDGVMAYLNDPFPCVDPPARAVSMARDLHARLDVLSTTWRDRGFDLGFGMGLAWGYATIGVFGSDQADYTALGTVVNLASRLCGEAGPGEILLDARAHDAVRQELVAERRDLVVKGFGSSVAAFRIDP